MGAASAGTSSSSGAAAATAAAAPEAPAAELESAEDQAWLTDWLVCKHFGEIDSTQSYVEREHESFDQSKLTAVSADFQTAGRGTGSRSWLASKGNSVLVTFFFRFPPDCETAFVNRNVANVTKVVSVAALDALRWAVARQGGGVDADGVHLGIKWPNDVVANGHKIGGVLARAVPAPTGARLDGVIVGAGININTPREELEGLDRPVWPATSLLAVSSASRPFDIAAVRGRFVRSFAMELRTFFSGGFPAFRARVNALEVLMGQRVHFRVRDSVEMDGVFEGVDDEGLILLRLDSGEVQAFPSGEIVPRAA